MPAVHDSTAAVHAQSLTELVVNTVVFKVTFQFSSFNLLLGKYRL